MSKNWLEYLSIVVQSDIIVLRNPMSHFYWSIKKSGCNSKFLSIYKFHTYVIMSIRQKNEVSNNIYQHKLYSISQWIHVVKSCFYPNTLINWTFFIRYQITFSENAVSIWIRFCMRITDDENSLDKFGSERLLLLLWLCKFLRKCVQSINYPIRMIFCAQITRTVLQINLKWHLNGIW